MKALPKKMNRLIGQAMHAYQMLSDGDKVLVAVSGGVDSLVLAYVLTYWQKKAPISYDLLVVHLDMGFDTPSWPEVKHEIEKIPTPSLIEETSIGRDAFAISNDESGCFHCSRNRRNRLFEIARQKGYNKIALGHHKDDIIETFFLNIFYSGNLSTMVPKQVLFEGRLDIIRPLAYLEKSEVVQIADEVGLIPVKNPCPMAQDSKREEIRTFLETFFDQNPSFKANVFSSLANVRQEYLLKPLP